MLHARFGLNWPCCSGEEGYQCLLLSSLKKVFQRTWISFKLRSFVPHSIETGQRLLRRFSLKCCQCIFAITLSSSLQIGHGHAFQQNLIFFIRGYFVLTLVQWFKKIFICCQSTFPICYYLPLEKSMALHLKTPEFSSTKNVCAKFDWNWPSGSGDEDKIVKMLHTDR